MQSNQKLLFVVNWQTAESINNNLKMFYRKGPTQNACTQIMWYAYVDSLSLLINNQDRHNIYGGAILILDMLQMLFGYRHYSSRKCPTSFRLHVLAHINFWNLFLSLRMLPTIFEEKAKNYFTSMSLRNKKLNRLRLRVHYTAENHCPTMYHKATIGPTIQHPWKL